MLKQFFRRGSSEFRARAPDRDRQSDLATLGNVGKSIEDALKAMQAEMEGLSRRLEDASSRASLVVGTDHDEYLSREPAKLAGLRKFEQEMRLATLRLKILNENIVHLRFVRATFYSRFPKLTPATGGPAE